MTREISERIGQRIIEAANLAVAMHLESGVANERHLHQGQLQMTGGAGFEASRDGGAVLEGRPSRANFYPRRKDGLLIYGLYLSATGVLANSYRQDVIANNLANSETVGFKKDLALFTERSNASEEAGKSDPSDPLSALTGGMWAAPTYVDPSEGPLQETGNSTDMAIEGNGYFMVKTPQGNRLTRDGRFLLDNSGNVVMAGDANAKLLDTSGKPITLDSRKKIDLGKDGELSQSGRNIAQVGVYKADSAILKKQGSNLLAYPDSDTLALSANYTVHQKFVERSNVEPADELTQLMDAERQLEANANMIKTQDETLGELVNTVAKIS